MAEVKERVGGGTCPFCGKSGSWPDDGDSWMCPHCGKQHPTFAFKCHHADCWEWAFEGSFCSLHDPKHQRSGKSTAHAPRSKKLRTGNQDMAIENGRQPPNYTPEESNNSPRFSSQWPSFAKRLAQTLAAMQEDQYLIVSIKETNRFVQFAAGGSWGTRAEVVSNQYLPKPQRLNARKLQRLRDLGWQDPTGTAKTSTPENDPDGSPNYFVEWPTAQPLDELAQLAVRTFIEALDAPHPFWLQYDAFGEGGKPLAFPQLGIKHKPLSSDDEPELRERLRTAVRSITRLKGLDYGEDGALLFSRGSAEMSVGLVGDPPKVVLSMVVMDDVEPRDTLLGRINDINRELKSMHVSYNDGVIVAVTTVSASPFVAGQVRQALEELAVEADWLGDIVQAEFGGRLAAKGSTSGATRH